METLRQIKFFLFTPEGLQGILVGFFLSMAIEVYKSWDGVGSVETLSAS